MQRPTSHLLQTKWVLCLWVKEAGASLFLGRTVPWFSWLVDSCILQTLQSWMFSSYLGRCSQHFQVCLDFHPLMAFQLFFYVGPTSVLTLGQRQTATLAQRNFVRWANVTKNTCQRWANVCPASGQRNFVRRQTLDQRWTNVGKYFLLTLDQRPHYHVGAYAKGYTLSVRYGEIAT